MIYNIYKNGYFVVNVSVEKTTLEHTHCSRKTFAFFVHMKRKL